MKVRKKGFTLIEIIISLVLIIIIGTIPVIIFSQKKDNNIKEIYNLVVNSASVKYTGNKEELVKIQNNNGYKVYEINELIKEGLIEEQNYKNLLSKIPDDLKEEYKKIVLKYDYADLGNIDYIYPYIKNGDLFLESFPNTYFIKNDSDFFSCKYDMDEVEIYYFDENYERKKYDGDLSNLKCIISEVKYNFDILNSVEFDEYNENINIDRFKKGINYVNYVIKIGEKYYQTYINREVYYIDSIDIVAFKSSNKVVLNKESEPKTWFNDDIELRLYSGDFEINKEILNQLNLKAVWTINNQEQNYDTAKIVLSNEGYYEVTAKLKNAITDIYISDTPIKIGIDKTNPKIKFEIENPTNITLSDEESGLQSYQLYCLNDKSDWEIKKSESFTTNVQIETIDITCDKAWQIKLRDKAGNQIIKQSNQLPYINIASVGNVFDFYIEVANIKQIMFDFDVKNITDNLDINYKDDFKKYMYNKLLINEKTSATEGTLNEIYEFSFYDIAETIFAWYNGNRKCSFSSTGKRIECINNISSSQLNNLTLDINITAKDLEGNELSYNYEVKLNAYYDDYFGGQLFSYKNWMPMIGPINANGDLVFREKSGRNFKLFIKEIGEPYQLLLDMNQEINVYYFDNDILEFGYEYNIDLYNNGKGFYNYNLNDNTMSTQYQTLKYPNNEQKESTDFENLIDKEYYSTFKNYLALYEELESVHTTNPDTIEMLRSGNTYGDPYLIFNQQDEYKSFLIFKDSGDRADYAMYFYNENPSITKKIKSFKNS